MRCSLSREGTALAVAVFDPNGKLVYRGDTKAKGGISTASAVYSESPMATTILFLLENLQPPAFEIASYLCGDSIEASAGHRALFILPNSFVGMLGRYDGTKFDREVFLPLLMGPSLILSIWLAFCIRKDAKILGLSGTANKWWTAGDNRIWPACLYYVPIDQAEGNSCYLSKLRTICEGPIWRYVIDAGVNGKCLSLRRRTGGFAINQNNLPA